MATRRLSESQKKELVESYRTGATSTSLSKEYGCSVNTVTRTLKNLLPESEYTSLKASRSRSASIARNLGSKKRSDSEEKVITSVFKSGKTVIKKSDPDAAEYK